MQMKHTERKKETDTTAYSVTIKNTKSSTDISIISALNLEIAFKKKKKFTFLLLSKLFQKFATQIFVEKGIVFRLLGFHFWIKIKKE